MTAKSSNKAGTTRPFSKYTKRGPGKKYSGSFNLRVGSELHQQLAMAAQAGRISLNELCVRRLETPQTPAV
jgi:predicted HicB family RNase H-like nuclease